LFDFAGKDAMPTAPAVGVVVLSLTFDLTGLDSDDIAFIPMGKTFKNLT
jgi:hypothetical protein